MANYDRKKAGKAEDTRNVTLQGFVKGMGALLLGSAWCYIKHEGMRQELWNEINELQRKIDKIELQEQAYRGKPFGKVIYKQEINELNEQKTEYKQTLEEKKKKL